MGPLPYVGAGRDRTSVDTFKCGQRPVSLAFFFCSFSCKADYWIGLCCWGSGEGSTGWLWLVQSNNGIYIVRTRK